MKLFGKEVSWKLLVILTVLLSPFIYNLDAIQGRIKFEIMCRKYGGTMIYGNAEKNEGWRVEAKIRGVDMPEIAFQTPFRFGDIGFVRYRKRDGEDVDVILVDPKAFGNKRFEFSVARATVAPRYKYSFVVDRLPDDSRFEKTSQTVTEIASGRKIAEHIAFGFEWARRERTILNAPTMTRCQSPGNARTDFFGGIYGSGRRDERANHQ